jgi:hypothetical protein
VSTSGLRLRLVGNDSLWKREADRIGRTELIARAWAERSPGETMARAIARLELAERHPRESPAQIAARLDALERAEAERAEAARTARAQLGPTVAARKAAGAEAARVEAARAAKAEAIRTGKLRAECARAEAARAAVAREEAAQRAKVAQSEKVRAGRSAAARVLWADPVRRAAVVAKMRDPEAVAKRSAAMRGKPSPAVRPEVKERIAATQRARYADPAERERLAATQRARWERKRQQRAGQDAASTPPLS